jgi:hypothetical protein
VIIGFSSGDIIWFDPISNKYGRLNKNVNPFPATVHGKTQIANTTSFYGAALMLIEISSYPGHDKLAFSFGYQVDTRVG